MTLPVEGQNDFVKLLNPAVYARLGRIRQAFFDFDGTLSVLRQGWESVMAPLMLESISPDQPASAELVAEVHDYVDRSTGLLTIRQMEWLAQAVERHGRAGAAETPRAYKSRFSHRLNLLIKDRTARLFAGEASADEFRLAGALEFVAGLAGRGVRLYLASGSDHDDVVRETQALGLNSFFTPRIYGALDQSDTHDKARLIRQVIDENNLHGDELLIVGDGPVEIIEGKRHGGITLGVASDEIARQGWNPRKVRRLSDAGADLLVADFRHSTELIDLLLNPPGKPESRR